MTPRSLGGLPKPEPGELTVDDVAARTGYSGAWVRELARKSDGLPNRAVHHGTRTHYFFQPADVDAYMAKHPRGSRATAVAQGPPSDEIPYLREQIERLQAECNRLQEEMMRLKVDWSAGEARLDEMRRICDRQAQTIERLAEAVKESGQAPATLGN